MVAIAVAAVLAAGYFGWLRNSSLVAVRDIEITGVTSGDRDRIVAALAGEARGMTTLDVDSEALAAAVAGFPTVASVSADADFPHGLTIEVRERPPVLVARTAGGSVAVAADGTVLPAVSVSEDQALPTIAVAALPESGRLEGEALDQALVVGAAPEPLRPLVTKVSVARQLGVVVALRGGFEVRFGDPERIAAKWTAATAVLADPKLTTLAYVDVRVPGRPAVGGAEPAPAEVAATAPVVPAATDVATDPAAGAPTTATTP